ncbi:nuclear envelope pore membrane protein POM 121 isoform X2 [Myxocyprinus asiaticus]|uniref:nuclear envelope pore membrane protein POM 121 isoform X2 n=1 Tax=Myxocyprinus asiaticus TaxID=70543 RepID=UPI002221DE7C|nr:nuclear envelope pore membrane protein POM 121 isoform X2 [Myxocyprinus asiaticus]
MSPEDKRRLVVISAAVFSLFILLLVLSYIPAYLYIIFISVVSCIFYFQKAEELQLFERLGLNPRCGLSVPPALLRWLPGRTLSGVPASSRNKIRKSDTRNSFASPSDRHIAGSYYRRDHTLSDSVFSPRDILMGSYLAKDEESPSAAARPAGGSGTFIHPRNQLRERLARPNHAVHTPNRRLSFGDHAGTVSRFTITPHRHYPLQQTGTSPIGIMPPAKWDGLRKKNILSQRNSPTIHSPVTVKIARPDPTHSSFFNHLNSPGAVTSPGIGAQADPCSRETVLSVLRESRKREVDEEEKSASSGQKSKRRRHDSSGSSQSAFEPPLANGAPSQLVPKPGSLKRGINSSLIEESTMKRSRTSSISSVSGAPVPSGAPGSVRNSIRSSYSSSQGYPQRRTASSLSLSPFTSPGGSRCQTPERAAKKSREDDATSPSSTPLTKIEQVATDPAPATSKLTPKSEAPVATSTSDSGGSSGKRKRKIQLVTTNRGDQISLPPPPELGYTITVKDLDMEKKAALSQIQKVLAEPEPEIPPPVPEPAPAPAPSLILFSQPTPTSSSETVPVTSAAPSLVSLSTPVPETTPATTTTPAPSIDLTVTAPSTASTALLTLPSATSITTTPAAPTSSISNPLLESLKNMKNNPLLSAAPVLGTTTAAPAVSVASLSTPAASSNPSSSVVKTESGPTALQSSFSTPSSISTPASKPATSMPSAFAQILARPLQPTSSSPSLGGGGSLFSLIKPVATPATEPPIFTTAAPTATATPSVLVNSIGTPLSSGFKPIFGAATTAPASTVDVKPTQPTFKPLFDSTTGSGIIAFGKTAIPTTSTPAAPATQNSGMLFGGITSTQPATVSAPSATPALQASTPSLFGSWNTTTTSAPASNTAFQFGATSTTITAPALSTSTASAGGTTSAFQFGAAKPAPTPQMQNTFTFGQQSNNLNSTSTPFGGFGLTNNATVTSEAPTTQTTFGSSTFTASTSFPGASQQAPAASKPFTFGSSSGNTGAAPFTFGAAASTAAPAFGTNSQPAFGGAPSTGFSFGNTTTPSVAPAFGASTQTTAPIPTPAPTFTFGGALTATQNPTPSTLAPPAAGGFNFGASLSGTPFGTPTPAAQTPGFSFGANNTDSKPAFGTPAFGQGSGGMSMPFSSPGTPGFGAMAASPFGASPASFSIGTGSKPSGQRRSQARRQHPRKK